MPRRSLLVIALLAYASCVNPSPTATSFGFGGTSGGGSTLVDAGPGCAAGEPTPGCACFAGERFACSCGSTLTCPTTEVWETGCNCPTPTQQSSFDGGGGLSCLQPSPDVGCPGATVVGPLGCCVAVGSLCSFAQPDDGGSCQTGQLLLDAPCELDGIRECAPCSALMVPDGDGGTVSLFVVSDSGSCPPNLVTSNGCCAPASWLDAGTSVADAGDGGGGGDASGDAGRDARADANDAQADVGDAAADVTRP